MRKASRFRARVPGNATFHLEGIYLSRPAAIARIREYIDASGIDIQALQLIELFHIGLEELAEAGLSYEHLKVIERNILFS